MDSLGACGEPCGGPGATGSSERDHLNFGPPLFTTAGSEVPRNMHSGDLMDPLGTSEAQCGCLGFSWESRSISLAIQFAQGMPQEVVNETILSLKYPGSPNLAPSWPWRFILMSGFLSVSCLVRLMQQLGAQLCSSSSRWILG